MIYLKKANLDDAEKEYELLQKIPAIENGFENKFHDLSYDEFLSEGLPAWIGRETGQNLPEGYVPDTHYFLWDDDTPVGLFNLRHYLNDFLRDGPGHIGYGIAEEYRGHGYATKGLKLVLDEARKLPLDTPEAYLQVFKSNPASLRVMQKNGGYITGEDDEHYYVRIKL